MPRLPYPAITSGCAGSPRSGWSSSAQDIVGVAGHRAEQAPVGAAVGAEAGGGLGHRAGHDRGPAAVERIGELDLGPREPDAARGQVEAPEERRRHRQRVRRPSRRRAGSPAGSAPRSGSRPRSSGAPSITWTFRPAAARVTAAARPFGPLPTITASGFPRMTAVLLICRRRTVARPRHRRRDGLQHAADHRVVPDVAGVTPLASGVHAGRCLVSTFGSGTPSRSPSAVSVAAQNLSSLGCPPNVIPTSYSGSFARISTWAWTTVSRRPRRLALGGEGDPAGEHVTLRGHQRERLGVGVQDEYARSRASRRRRWPGRAGRRRRG